LCTDPDSFPNSLPTSAYPVGVVAGIRQASILDLIPGKDDGLVPPESAKIDAMVDLATAKANHMTIRYSREVSRQTIAFCRLENSSSIPDIWGLL
jgi:hypothetical protein